MNASVRTTSSVPEGFALLSEMVAVAKAAPLAQITVIVPSHRSGLDVTRHLARTVNRGRGLLNVHARTLADIAALLHERSGAGAGRALLTPLVRQGAVQSVLSENPGGFALVADQPATAAALSRASATLELVDTAMAEREHLSALAQEVLRVHDASRAGLSSGCFTSHDQFVAAVRLIETDAPAVSASLGTVISFLLSSPDDLDVDCRRLLGAMTAAVPVDEVVLTGDPPPVNTRTVSATDPDDEARAVARIVVGVISKGTPANRVGVFWGSEQPYRALLHRHLADAGVTVNGPAARQLPDTALARGLLALLGLDASALDLRIVFDVLSEGSLNWSAKQLPSSAQCERLYGTSLLEEPEDEPVGPVRFIDLEAEGGPAAELTTQSAARVARERKDLARQRLVADYLAALTASLHTVAGSTSWAEAADAVESLIAEHFAVRSVHEDVLEHLHAREGLQHSIAALRMLDGVAPAPGIAHASAQRAVAAALESELHNNHLSHNKAGVGVSLGSLEDAVARDLDVVITVGLAEGVTPARQRDDPLLPDALRLIWGGDLPLFSERTLLKKAVFHAALASAASACIITYPRGDLRGGGERLASRWLADITFGPSYEVGSYHEGIVAGTSPDEMPVSAQHWRMRHARTPTATRPTAPVDQRLDAARSMRRGRLNGAFTRYTGDLSSVTDLITVLDGAITPTSLEDWVTSPLSYFLHRILGLRPFEDVTLQVEIDALTRGTLLHEILEHFILGQLAGDDGSHTLARLLEIAQVSFDQYKADVSAVNWLKHLWQRDMRAMRTDLQLWWERYTESGRAPHSAEASFGTTDAPHQSVKFVLGDDTVIHLAGQVDRIDWNDDGSVHVVDYKAGKSTSFSGLTESTPTAGGKKFQLPTYGLFAQREAAEVGRPGPVHAEYDFISRVGGQKSVGYEVTDDVVSTFREDVGDVVTAIRSGLFPPVPGPTMFTNFTTLTGAAGMKQLWARMRDAPELASISHFWPTDEDES